MTITFWKLDLDWIQKEYFINEKEKKIFEEFMHEKVFEYQNTQSVKE